MIINGKKVKAKKTFNVRYPYTNEVIAKVPDASKQDIVKAMKLSYNKEKNLKPDKRIEILEKTAKEIKNHNQEIARLITSESGICIKDTLYEVNRVYNVLTLGAKAIPKIEEDKTSKFVDGNNEKPRLRVITEPLDLVLGITPFNHPMNQVAHKVVPAIMAGTAMALKPTEKTPLSALKLAELLHDAGLPPNFLNVVTSNKPSEFLEHALSTKLAQLVTFTGGVDVGKYIARRIAETGNELVRYVAELGDSSPFIVLEDADIKLAAKVALNAYGNSGQRCTKMKRLIVHNKITNQFIEEFLKLTEAIKYGDPMDPGTGMGTVINEAAAKLIQSRVNSAIKDGAKLLYGNIRQGALYSPTLLDKVNPKSELVVKETFGPVAPIIRINNTKEAIEIINSLKFKLAGAVMTKSREHAELISNSIKVGQFNWNNHPSYRTEQAPFGGFCDSGNGEKEGVIMAAESMRRIRTFYEH